MTYLHEISHNLFCNHAGKWGSRGYEDMSGAMGYCCDLRCHNAPHALQVGGVCCVLGGDVMRCGVGGVCGAVLRARVHVLFAAPPKRPT